MPKKTAPYFSLLPPAGHIPALDGLRGIAILLVVLHHATLPIWSAHQGLFPIAMLGGWDPGRLLAKGWVGVDLFFVLSGFLITHHIFGRYLDKKEFRWGHYFLRRALRIVPAYYGVLLLTAVGFFPFFTLHGGEEDLLWRVFYHLLFLQDYLPPDIQLSFWSLGVEEKFYIAAPILVLGLTGIKKPWQRYAFFALLLAYTPLARWATFLSMQAAGAVITSDQVLFLFRTPFHLAWDGLIIGMLCAFLARDEKFRFWAKRYGFADISFWAGVVLTAVLMSGTKAYIIWQALLFGFSFGLILLGCVLGARAAAGLQGRALRFFAVISYSLYLTHIPLFDATAKFMKLFADFSQWGAAGQFFIFTPVYLAVSTAAAIAFYFALEKPFLNLRDRLR